MMRDAGLIETVRVRGGTAPLWSLHAARLERSSRALGLPVPEVPVPSGGPDRIVRLVWRAEGLETGERPVPEPGAIRLALVSVIHEPYPHKTTARDRFDQALREAAALGAGDALLLTGEGWVAECARWAVFWWEGERLAAPPLELGILPSVARARIARLVGGIVERRIVPGDLVRRSPFLANAARGITEVAALHGETLPSDARTRALGTQFWP